MRRDITRARQLLDEREAAVDEAEAAMARLREVFGIGKGKRAEAAPVAAGGHIAAAVGTAHGRGAAQAWMARVRSCKTCGASFQPHHGRQRYGRDHLTTKYQPAPETETEREPLPERECRYCAEEFQPHNAEQVVCSDLCRRLLKEDNYAREHAENGELSEAQSPVPT